MMYHDWLPYYYWIVKTLHLSIHKDFIATKKLSILLNCKYLSQAELRESLMGKYVIVLGPYKDTMLSKDVLKSNRIIVADSAITLALDLDIVPDITVTDLDAKESDLVQASRLGSIISIHAHGDNIDKLTLTHRFSARFGTTQVLPLYNIYNFGGFTDGDRAVFLAWHFGARKIILSGFEFTHPAPKTRLNYMRKKQKLKIAEYLINVLKYRYGANISIR